MTDLIGLIERLSKASGADRELDRLLTEVTGYPHAFRRADGSIPEDQPCAQFTASIDAALALVERKLPGERVAMERFASHAFCVVKPNSDDEYLAEAPTLPLALCLALLRALHSQESP